MCTERRSRQANSRLQTLRLSKNHFTVDQLATLATTLEGNDSLIALVLDDNDLGPDSAVEIARILRRSSLKTLSLAGNRIGDDGAEAIANALLSNKTLTSLNLEYNDITSKGILSVSQALAQVNDTIVVLQSGLHDVANSDASRASFQRQVRHSNLESTWCTT